jgi:hypothetical protein
LFLQAQPFLDHQGQITLALLLNEAPITENSREFEME